jgi:hypothetical protein
MYVQPCVDTLTFRRRMRDHRSHRTRWILSAVLKLRFQTKWLVVIFQQVVHSIETREADCAEAITSEKRPNDKRSSPQACVP